MFSRFIYVLFFYLRWHVIGSRRVLANLFGFRLISTCHEAATRVDTLGSKCGQLLKYSLVFLHGKTIRRSNRTAKQSVESHYMW